MFWPSNQVESVNGLLESLLSKDKDTAKRAEEDIDEYLKAEEKRRRDEEYRKELTAGCRTVADRSSINVNLTREAAEERRRREAEKLKAEGNRAFKNGEYSLAEELYTRHVSRG